MPDMKESLMVKNTKLLGDLLGDIINEATGKNMIKLLKSIRKLSRASHAGDLNAHKELVKTLENLTDDEFLIVAKSFNQFLNLTNTVEQYNTISTHGEGFSNPVNFLEIFKKFKSEGLSDNQIIEAIKNISIDLVLTAHPTEINRRSLITNLNEVDTCLSQLDHDDISDFEKEQIYCRLKQLIAQYWYTDEIRPNRPTPNEEAKWGYDVVENSLWTAVPAFLRELDTQIQQVLPYSLPIDSIPVTFGSWMGGDRDGNPNVTAKVTHNVLLNGRRRAATLFLSDIETLVKELSMRDCTQAFRDYTQNQESKEPYRDLTKIIRSRLKKTIAYLDSRLLGKNVQEDSDLILKDDDLWIPLYECYKSLVTCNMKIIADNNLLSTLRRIRCFGVTLVKIDVRQESTIHTNALSEITRYLELGDYAEWTEDQKQQFLLKELNSKRPLIPHKWNASAQTQEVLDTFKVIASTEAKTIPTYVISMTQAPSDILAIYLFLKEADCPYHLPVTPLFETLEDLNNAEDIMNQLFEIEWYRNEINHKQMIMIGYSDSAKDAGSLAAGWAQYRAQESLIKKCKEKGVQLTLFHGRGGTTGRGGGPAKLALFSQPPGSLEGGLRVTEQGEMIRFKLGRPKLAIKTLSIYTDAILSANLLPPPVPQKEWRTTMDVITAKSCKIYQDMVRKDPNFVPYFYQATPEAELTKLPLGSRPAKRRSVGGIETLRAIPWIFGWTQNRLMLPAWLGTGAALRESIEEGHLNTLKEMVKTWPFFGAHISMLEMVFAKADVGISKHYDDRLVSPELQHLGTMLRDMLKADIDTVLKVLQEKDMMEGKPKISENIAMRNIYTSPLNLLQIELLYRSRQNIDHSAKVEQALMVTISGIAAGMRNSG